MVRTVRPAAGNARTYSMTCSAVTAADVGDYARRWPAENLAALTIGPEPIDAAKYL